MKKIVWGLILIAIIVFAVLSKDPLNDLSSFVIGGSIPGTSISVGFWSTMGIAGVIVLLIFRGIKNARLQMLEQTAKQIKSERLKTEFEATNGSEFDQSQRSVIAARTSENGVF